MGQGQIRLSSILTAQVVVAAASLLLVADPAVAASRSNRAAAANQQAQERAARKACLNGDYAKGVSILSDLFVDTKNPTYIYNQARCFEQNRRYEDAVARFEEYLHAPDAKLSEEDRAAAEQRLADCREKVAKEHVTSTFPPPQPTVPAPATPEPAATPAPAPATPAPTIVKAAPQPARGGSRLLTAGIVTGAVGVAALVGGVVLNLKANSMASDMENGIGAYSSAKENDQKGYQTLAWVGYGVGAACVATGAVLLGIGLSSRSKSRTGASTDVALVPAVSPGQMGALLTGAF